ncbi:MAG TPA: MarC family protein [Vicinamibacterales bacterium]
MATLLQDVVALLAISNPLGALPVFLALTQGATPAERTRAGLRTAVAATAILTVAALAGRPILSAFGISMPALQAAGGLVILMMGLEMLHGAPTRVQHDEGNQQSAADRVLVPLAMPLLAGPGAITTVLTLSSRLRNWTDTMMLLMAVLVLGVTIALILLSASRLGRALGSHGQRILLRFMGLILAAVGAEILLAGVYTFVPRA